MITLTSLFSTDNSNQLNERMQNNDMITTNDGISLIDNPNFVFKATWLFSENNE